MTEIEISGTDTIRAALRQRNHKSNFAVTARDLGISNEALYAFSIGQSMLQVDVLKALAKVLWGGNVEYDADIDRLRPANREKPRSMGVAPLPFEEVASNFPTGAGHRGPRPEKPQRPQPKTPRPGWAE